MTVKRYGSVLFDTGLIEMACGDYVTYSDYQKLVAERDSLKAKLDIIHALMNVKDELESTFLK